jgi:hypothetical protein
MSTDVSEEYIASIFRVEKMSARNQRASRWKMLATCFHTGSCSVYSSTLKMEAICSSETSADIQWTTRRYIPEDNNRQYQRYLPKNDVRQNFGVICVINLDFYWKWVYCLLDFGSWLGIWSRNGWHQDKSRGSHADPALQCQLTMRRCRSDKCVPLQAKR